MANSFVHATEPAATADNNGVTLSSVSALGCKNINKNKLLVSLKNYGLGGI